jgi:16S rRNA (adenine1518-N6/adenine1519-N6)-dimethyltransferase
MNLHRPSELIRFLEEQGFAPRKRLSQNFLIDGNIVRKMVVLAGVQPGSSVIEIGPGPGVLTEALLAAGAHVRALELDSGFARALERLQTTDHRLEVIAGDALEFPFAAQGPCHIVANLPYHITTPLLAKILPLYPQVTSITIMVQKEFAERMLAEPGSKECSHLSLFTRYYSTVASHFIVKPSCFYPRPRVHSAVVRCIPHAPPLEEETVPFFELTRRAFQHKRKMLRASLKELAIEQALSRLHLPLTARPQELSLDQWVALFLMLKRK